MIKGVGLAPSHSQLLKITAKGRKQGMNFSMKRKTDLLGKLEAGGKNKKELWKNSVKQQAQFLIF